MVLPHRILIIDDDPLYVMTTKAILESQGYEVDSASDGDQGLAMLAKDRPDLVLLDVMMDWPLEGVSVSRQMLNSRDLRSIPIIMITSIRRSEHLDAFPRDEYLHIHGWLDKPYTPDHLVAEVAATLARHQRSENSVAQGIESL